MTPGLVNVSPNIRHSPGVLRLNIRSMCRRFGPIGTLHIEARIKPDRTTRRRMNNGEQGTQNAHNCEQKRHFQNDWREKRNFYAGEKYVSEECWRNAGGMLEESS